MFDSILSQLKTKDQADHLVEELNNLKFQEFKPDLKSREEQIKNELGASYASELISIVNNQNISDFAKFIDDLISQIKQKKEISLVIAFEPRVKTIDHIYTWVSQNISKDILIDIQVDPSIVGGAQITFEGKYGDYSLQNLLSAELNTKGNEYLKILNKNG